MASVVGICNRALSYIRAGSINSITESSLQAQQCNLHYSDTVRTVLASAPWGFAKKIEALAERSDIDIFNWAYAYQYPSDSLRINRLILNYEKYSQADGVARITREIEKLYLDDLDAQVKYEVINEDGDKIIVANEPELRAEYNIDITDPNLFDPIFIDMVTRLLAANVAVGIVGADKGRQFVSDNLQIYQSFLDSAVSNTLNERYMETPDSDFITVRRS